MSKNARRRAATLRVMRAAPAAVAARPRVGHVTLIRSFDWSREQKVHASTMPPLAFCAPWDDVARAKFEAECDLRNAARASAHAHRSADTFYRAWIGL